MFKAHKLFLVIAVVICAGLLLGMTLGRISDPQIIYRDAETSLPDPALAQGTPEVDHAPAPAETPHAYLSTRPDLDYDEEVWPEDAAAYRYDPDYEPYRDEDFEREYRRTYGRDYHWPDGSGEVEGNAPDFASADEVEPPAIAKAGPTAESHSTNRYDSKPTVALANAAPNRPQDREEAPAKAAPSAATASEPRAADAPLPAIW